MHLPSSSRRTLAFPPNVRGRRVAPSSRSLSPCRALPVIRARLTPHEAASFVFVLRPADLASTPDWVRGAVSGQVPPRCYHPNAPPACLSPKATDRAGSFHPASKRFRYLIHVRLDRRRDAQRIAVRSEAAFGRLPCRTAHAPRTPPDLPSTRLRLPALVADLSAGHPHATPCRELRRELHRSPTISSTLS